MDTKPSRGRILVRIILLVLFFGLIAFVTINYGSDFTRLMSRPERSRAFIASYGAAGPLIYIAIQIMQVVVFVIPGEVVQVAGGYVFGTVLGTLYATIGAALGTFIAFMATRLLGFALIKTFVPRKTIDKFDFLLNSQKSEVALFALFLLPGVPKDVLVYIAGLTPIKPLRFVVISMLARFPGLLGSAYVGAHLAKKSYWPVVIVSAVALVLFALGLIFGDRIIEAVRRRGVGRSKSHPD